MEKRDKIVVFREYETSIDANVAKTKLDAYGVPCFLTQENLNTLMAQNPFLFRIKLHIFENDVIHVREVLDELFDYEAHITCPQCESTEIMYSESTKGFNKFAAVAFSFLFHIRMTPKKVHHCLDCRLEF
jgi:hypothetical protein